MTARQFFSSATRISDLRSTPFETVILPKTQWATADYVVAEVTGRPNRLYRVELDNGRMTGVIVGDHIVGVFGKRAATLEGVGDWEAIGEDHCMEALTPAGLFGKATSTSPLLPHFMHARYVGHVARQGRKLNMADFVREYPDKPLAIPVIMLIGTSMSAGKTTAGRMIIHELKAAGFRVAAAKFTGAARYRDILSFRDAGADHIFDFVDVGLPSTVCPAEPFRRRLKQLIARIASLDVNVLVVEAGASPMEPYNGDVAVQELKDNICFTVLCASDPYAVAGVQAAFHTRPDLVAGPAANTQAAIELVGQLTGARALNLVDPESLPELRRTLVNKIRGETK